MYRKNNLKKMWSERRKRRKRKNTHTHTHAHAHTHTHTHTQTTPTKEMKAGYSTYETVLLQDA